MSVVVVSLVSNAVLRAARIVRGFPRELLPARPRLGLRAVRGPL